jgi:predicted metal-dependent peptidase
MPKTQGINMAISRDKRVDRAQLKVLFSVPFFAPAVARLPVVFDDSIPTACTAGKEIRFNGKWFDTLPDPVVATVLAHEACHCLLGHLWRAPGGVDWDIWNQACDHAVNLMLKEFSAQVIANRLADPFPFPDPQDAYCANPAFAGMNEEKIYQILSGQKGSGGGGQGQPGQGQGQGKHSMPSFGQMQQPANGQAAQAKQLQSSWDNTMIQSVTMAKGRGTVPGSVSAFVGELLDPKVPWWEVLRNWLREQASDDWNWMRPNEYFDESGFILPSLDSERIGAVVFGKDTSGSVTCYPEITTQFVTEQQNCLDDLRPSKLVDICCDTRITRVKEYVAGEAIDKDFPGGGGTDFRPIFEHCEAMPVPPKCLVILTDLDGTMPDKAPEFPVIWCVYGSKEQAPFGETIHAD